MSNAGLSASFSPGEATSCVATALLKMPRRRKLLSAKAHSVSKRPGVSETAAAAGRSSVRRWKDGVWRSNKTLAGGEIGERA